MAHGGSGLGGVIPTYLCGALMKINHIVMPCTQVWILLLLLTLAAFAAGEMHLMGLSTFAIIMIITLVKGHMIADFFMNLRSATALWRWLITGWLVFVISGISLAYWLSLQ